MDRHIDITGLPEQAVEAIEAIIRTYRNHDSAAARSPRKIGWASDQLPDLPATFFDDLPKDVLDSFEGKAA